MTILKLTADAIKVQEDQIRWKLSQVIREFPGTYVSLIAANLYLRITNEANMEALVSFYSRDYFVLTDLVQESCERNCVGANFPLLDYQRLLLYKKLVECSDQPYLVVKHIFQQLEHLFNLG